MSLQHGKCPKCSCCMILEETKDKTRCIYCGKEFIIPIAIRKCRQEGTDEFDKKILEAQQAMIEDDNALSLQKYYDALLIAPNDYRALWGAYICEIRSTCTQLDQNSYINFPGDGPKTLQDTMNRLGLRAHENAPNDVKIYYSKILDDERKRIAQYQNRFQSQVRTTMPSFTQKSPIKGCFIATMVYGSYDCPSLWILRRYRDQILSSSFFGKVFIKLYYYISPILIKMFSNNILFKKVCKNIIERKVTKLKKRGINDNPYID